MTNELSDKIREAIKQGELGFLGKYLLGLAETNNMLGDEDALSKFKERGINISGTDYPCPRGNIALGIIIPGYCAFTNFEYKGSFEGFAQKITSDINYLNNLGFKIRLRGNSSSEEFNTDAQLREFVDSKEK